MEASYHFPEGKERRKKKKKAVSKDKIVACCWISALMNGASRFSLLLWTSQGVCFYLLIFLLSFKDFVAPFLDFTLHISLSPFLFVQTVFHPPHASVWICSLTLCWTFSSYSLWLSGWSKRVLLKHWYLCMRLHSIITRVKIWINTTMKTWKNSQIKLLS